ncbi:MAG: iron-sulfur cluster repair di-iron protein [Acidobacteria bacterium]|nr:MAG: iron-sulfur cluster repair di-iron protein [Acidobacteriota bacterium]
MSFTSTTKVGDIAAANPAAKKVLEEAGVDYCCGGAKSLQDACLHTGVSAEEILKRLQENSRQGRPEEANWATARLADLTKHIVEKHHKYVRGMIPRVSALLAKVRAKHGENHPELAKIAAQFLGVGHEMYAHMQKEEQILFPYIARLERAEEGKEELEPPFFQTVRNPVHMMMQDHDTAGAALEAMRKLSSGYHLPAEACESYRELYRSLQEFEADMHTHVHLENNILFPRAVELEAKVL